MIQKIEHPAYENNAKKLNEIIDAINELLGIQESEESEFSSFIAGLNPVIVGKNAKATGEGAVSIGRNTKASFEDSIAIGKNAKSDYQGAITLGKNAKADAESTLALGVNSQARNTGAVAVGNNSIASEEYEFAVGAPESDGHDEIKRRITHVEDGVADSDAATIGQINEILLSGIDVDSIDADTINDYFLFSLKNYAYLNIEDYDEVTVLPDNAVSDLTIIIAAPDASFAFANCYELTGLNGLETTWDMSNVTSTEFMFSDCEAMSSLNLSSWDLSSLENSECMFLTCYGLTSITGMNNKNMPALIYADCMFDECEALEYLDVSGWNVPNVTDISDMFYYSTNLKSVNMNNWTVPDHIRNISSMFYGCESLVSADFSTWNSFTFDYADNLFRGCSSLKVVDISSFDNRNDTSGNSIFRMFYECDNLEYVIIDSDIVKFTEYIPTNWTISGIELNNTCKILVPGASIEAYRNAWPEARHNQFDAIEDYVITRSQGTITVIPDTEGTIS